MSVEDFADWVTDVSDMYIPASEAEILAKVRGFRNEVLDEAAEELRDARPQHNPDWTCWETAAVAVERMKTGG